MTNKSQIFLLFEVVLSCKSDFKISVPYKKYHTFALPIYCSLLPKKIPAEIWPVACFDCSKGVLFCAATHIDRE